MSLQRITKRAFYAAIPVAVLITIIMGIRLTSTLTQEPVPTPVPTILMAPIEVQEVSVIPHPVSPASAARSVDIVARLYNPNVRAGVESYPLTFTLLDAQGNEIAKRNIDTYLLPGSVQYVSVLNLSFEAARQVGRVEVETPAEVAFTRIPSTVELPRFSLFLQNRTERTAGPIATVVQTGIVRNTGTFDWQRVEVRAVALNEAGNVIGVGQTFVGRLLVGEQREFTLEWPKSSEPISQVIAVPSTNLFEEENVVEIIGDPSSLR